VPIVPATGLRGQSEVLQPDGIGLITWNFPGKEFGVPSVKSTTMRSPDWLPYGTARS